MVNIISISPPDQFGRVIQIDWHPPAGPIVRLTTAQWHDLLRELERIDPWAMGTGNFDQSA